MGQLVRFSDLARPAVTAALLAGFLGLGAVDAAPAGATLPPAQPASARLAAADDSQPNDEGGDSADADGPHSPANRQAAPLRVRNTSSARVFNVDLGDIDLSSTPGQFRAPMRGVIVTPKKRPAQAKGKLVIVNHLRNAACSNGTVFAYPCADGKEMRFDQGMTYFGEALAARGYTVVIPDLAPIYIGHDSAKPYSQAAGVAKVNQGLVRELARANAGSNNLKTDLKGQIDTTSAALITHSRSAVVSRNVIAEMGAAHGRDKSVPRITSEFAYGGFFRTPENAEAFSPALPDIPFMGMLGRMDDGVGSANADWVAEKIGLNRRSPLMVAVVPGLGHNYINRTLSRAKIDDRSSCDRGKGPGCATVAAHEKALIAGVSTWLSSRTRRTPAIPARATDPLPKTFAGLPAQWIALTNGPNRRWVASPATGRQVRTRLGSKVTICRYYASAQGRPPKDSCRLPDLGSATIRSYVASFKVPPKSSVGVRFAKAPTRATHLNVQLSMAADRKKGNNAIAFIVRTKNGGSYRLTPPANTEVLRNRSTSSINGTYLPGTIRFALPKGAQRGITRVDIVGTQRTWVLLRAIDLVAG